MAFLYLHFLYICRHTMLAQQFTTILDNLFFGTSKEAFLSVIMPVATVALFSLIVKAWPGIKTIFRSNVIRTLPCSPGISMPLEGTKKNIH